MGKMYPKQQQRLFPAYCNCCQICNNSNVERLLWRVLARGQGLNQEYFVYSSIMLICAVLASLAIGVLAAYGVCIAMFNIFRIHARQVAVKSARSVAPVRVVQG